VTRVRIFCTALFTNNNIKVLIQIDAFLAHLLLMATWLFDFIWESMFSQKYG
jgi:hypothetical protein